MNVGIFSQAHSQPHLSITGYESSIVAEVDLQLRVPSAAQAVILDVFLSSCHAAATASRHGVVATSNVGGQREIVPELLQSTPRVKIAGATQFTFRNDAGSR